MTPRARPSSPSSLELTDLFTPEIDRFAPNPLKTAFLPRHIDETKAVPRRARIRGSWTLASPRLRLKDAPRPVTRVKKKRRKRVGQSETLSTYGLRLEHIGHFPLHGYSSISICRLCLRFWLGVGAISESSGATLSVRERGPEQLTL